MATFVCGSAQAAVSRHVQLLPARKHVFTEGSPCVLPCVHAMKAETSCAGHVVSCRLTLALLVLEAVTPLSCPRLPASTPCSTSRDWPRSSQVSVGDQAPFKGRLPCAGCVAQLNRNDCLTAEIFDFM